MTVRMLLVLRSDHIGAKIKNYGKVQVHAKMIMLAMCGGSIHPSRGPTGPIRAMAGLPDSRNATRA